MNEADGFRVEAALQFGFEPEKFGDRDQEIYLCTEAQLIAFAKACERKGRAEASQMARERAHEHRRSRVGAEPTLWHRTTAGACALDVLAGALDMLNAATDAELKPVLEAERERVRNAPEDQFHCKCHERMGNDFGGA